MLCKYNREVENKLFTFFKSTLFNACCCMISALLLDSVVCCYAFLFLQWYPLLLLPFFSSPSHLCSNGLGREMGRQPGFGKTSK